MDISDSESRQRELEKLREENARLRAAQDEKNKITLKVGEKGGLSVYGLGRFPVTLYKEQWARLLEHREEILDYIEQHDGLLKSKGDK